LDKLPYDHDHTNGVFALIAVLSVNFHGVLQVFKVHITEGAHVMETSQDPLPNVNPVAVKAIKPPDEIATFGVTATENAPQYEYAAAVVSPRYTALGAKPEGTYIMGKLADAVAPRMSPALFRTAAGKAELAAHGIAGLVTDSNENEITEPEVKFPDEKTALKTPLNTSDDGDMMVAVPVAPETGEEKFSGLRT